MGRVIGLDPGLTAYGYAAVELTSTGEKAVDFGTWTTTKIARKYGILEQDDVMRRVRELRKELALKLTEHRPKIAVVEAFSPPRNASAAAKVAMVWGMTITLCDYHNVAVHVMRPQLIRWMLAAPKRGKDSERNAVKAWIVEAMMKRYDLFGSLLALGPLAHHAADALAAVAAATDAGPDTFAWVRDANPGGS